MALDYTIRFPNKIEEKEDLKQLIQNQDNNYFTLSELTHSDVGFLDGDFNDEYLLLEFNDYSYLNIRLDKFKDNIVAKRAMMTLVSKIVNEIYPNDDYYFEFNGNIIYELRIDRVTHRQKKCDFYKYLD